MFRLDSPFRTKTLAWARSCILSSGVPWKQPCYRTCIKVAPELSDDPPSGWMDGQMAVDSAHATMTELPPAVLGKSRVSDSSGPARCQPGRSPGIQSPGPRNARSIHGRRGEEEGEESALDGRGWVCLRCTNYYHTYGVLGSPLLSL